MVAALFAGPLTGLAEEPAAPPSHPDLVYVKTASRGQTRRLSLEATRQRLGGLEQGPWHIIGPFDNTGGRAAAAAHPIESGVDLQAEYEGAGGKKVAWRIERGFREARSNNLDLFGRLENSLCYLTRTLEAERDRTATLYLGSDDSIAVWMNGEKIHEFIGQRGMPKEKERVVVRLRKGTNRILLKVGNLVQAWQFHYDLPAVDPDVLAALEARLNADFPSTHEGTYYRLETIPTPPGAVIEVGGLAFVDQATPALPAGTLMVATRRGDVWAVRRPASSGEEPPPPAAGWQRIAGWDWRRFAWGLHEPLGLCPGGPGEFYLVQRPELTRLRDTDGDGRADRFETVSDAWGISGNYHEFVYGPVRDRQGSFWGTINLAHHDGGFGEMGSVAPWTGWAFRVSPDGAFTPWASGLRSPAGVGVNPADDVFYTDNQGGYVGTSFLAHVSRGAFHGHPASLHWDPAFRADAAQMPIEELDRRRKRPAVLFPHGELGHSPSQPLWDETGGRFGPFAGQMFVGDQTRSRINRVTLEKVDGEYQGACFPFHAGFLSGITRLAFGPDGSLCAGQTDRGWGSVGGHPFGLQRLAWTGRVPLDILDTTLTKDGFDLTFTLPLDAATAAAPEAWSVQHYHYLYQRAYGSPQMEITPAGVREARVSADRRRVSLALERLIPGKVYEIRAEGILAEDGSELLHPVAYYTLNRLKVLATPPRRD